MALPATFVLICSNIVISALQGHPGQVRLPCYIVIIATFVTVVQMVLRAFIARPVPNPWVCAWPDRR